MQQNLSQRRVDDEEAKVAPKSEEKQEIEMQELPKNSTNPPQEEESKVSQNTALEDEEAEVAELQV